MSTCRSSRKDTTNKKEVSPPPPIQPHPDPIDSTAYTTGYIQRQLKVTSARLGVNRLDFINADDDFI
eukprot:12902005-Ditylum_brightwellii.AAC.1